MERYNIMIDTLIKYHVLSPAGVQRNIMKLAQDHRILIEIVNQSMGILKVNIPANQENVTFTYERKTTS